MENLKRTSFDLTMRNSTLLKEYSKENQKNMSKAINEIIHLVLDSDPEVKQTISMSCLKMAKTMDEFIETEKESEFHKQRDIDKKIQCIRLANIFSYDRNTQMPKPMQKIPLKNGYVLIPDSSDWMVLDNMENPSNCMYAGVVELYTVADKKVFHYLYLCNNKPMKPEDSLVKKAVYEACCEKNPNFENEFQLNDSPMKEERIPESCFYPIIEEEEVKQIKEIDASYTLPYGCMIVRGNDCNKKNTCG